MISELPKTSLGGQALIRIVIAWLAITCPLYFILPLPWSYIDDFEALCVQLVIVLPVYVVVGVRIMYMMSIYYILRPNHPSPFRYCMKACHQFMNLAYCVYLVIFLASWVALWSVDIFTHDSSPHTVIEEAATRPSPHTTVQPASTSDSVRVNAGSAFQHYIDLCFDIFAKTNITWLLLTFFAFQKSVRDHFDFG